MPKDNETVQTVTDLPKKKRRIPRPSKDAIMKYGTAAALGAATVFVFVPRRAKVDVTLEETVDTDDNQS